VADLSLQEQYGFANRCFGCGPSNEKGLQIRSFVEGDELVARWTPQAHHLAFDGVLNGGICGALLDCHSNWAAAHHLMVTGELDELPCTVTASYSIKLRRPTPMDRELTIRARITSSEGDRVDVEAELLAGDKVTATCRGLFVAVKEDHPAFHRW
jgi:acyl-coenzyme A thioesterase PaaI-like protein